MPNYKRNYKKGGTYFFTVVTANRVQILRGDMIRVLRMCFKNCMQQFPFHMDAVVVLPDHLHCIWTLPENDADYSLRWKHIKARFTKDYIQRGAPVDKEATHVKQRRREKNVWQKRFWEHTIRDERDFRLHCDYIYYNPVKHGYVISPGQWPYSSFAQCVTKGWYDADWGSQPISFFEMIGGE